MTTPQSQPHRNLLQLSDQWAYLPLNIQLAIAGRIVLKKFRKMPRGKRYLIMFCASAAILGLIALILINIGAISGNNLIFGAWMFLLGSLATLAVILLTDRLK